MRFQIEIFLLLILLNANTSYKIRAVLFFPLSSKVGVSYSFRRLSTGSPALAAAAIDEARLRLCEAGRRQIIPSGLILMPKPLKSMLKQVIYLIRLNFSSKSFA
jgi:hypothetical protein